MKIFGLVASLFLVFNTIGQKSYYFSEPLSPMSVDLKQVPSNLFGIYTSSKSLRSFEVSEEGIFLISTTISSMDRESIRESSEYDVRNGFIFGIVEGDSLPCVLDNERYYFGVRNKDVLIGIGSLNVLSKVSSKSYLINVFENGTYIPMQITFEKKTLSISYFDYETDTKVFDFIVAQKSVASEEQELVILSPSAEEIKELITIPEVFIEPVDYKKEKK